MLQSAKGGEEVSHAVVKASWALSNRRIAGSRSAEAEEPGCSLPPLILEESKTVMGQIGDAGSSVTIGRRTTGAQVRCSIFGRQPNTR